MGISRFIAAVVGLAALAGCASGGGGPYRGIQLYEKGGNVYVCRQAHTADDLQALAEELRSGRAADGRTGQTVRIRARDSVRVGGSSVAVARVEEVDASRAYWIPYTALCSRSG